MALDLTKPEDCAKQLAICDAATPPNCMWTVANPADRVFWDSARTGYPAALELIGELKALIADFGDESALVRTSRENIRLRDENESLRTVVDPVVQAQFMERERRYQATIAAHRAEKNDLKARLNRQRNMLGNRNSSINFFSREGIRQRARLRGRARTIVELMAVIDELREELRIERLRAIVDNMTPEERKQVGVQRAWTTNTCRICGGSLATPWVYGYGYEFAHPTCVEQETAKAAKGASDA